MIRKKHFQKRKKRAIIMEKTLFEGKSDCFVRKNEITDIV